MRFAAFLPVLSLVAAAAVEPRDETNTSPRRDVTIIKVSSGEVDADLESRDLQSRACIYNGCRCKTGMTPGVYCGSCNDGNWVITKKRVAMHAYQCARNGNCCDYGYRNNCDDWGGKCPE